MWFHFLCSLSRRITACPRIEEGASYSSSYISTGFTCFSKAEPGSNLKSRGISMAVILANNSAALGKSLTVTATQLEVFTYHCMFARSLIDMTAVK